MPNIVGELGKRKPSTKYRGSNARRQQRVEKSRCGIALDFLHNLRPEGPWLLTAIRPDGGATTTVTAATERQAEELIWTFNGVRNLYYSANPTRRALTSKASKHDIAAIQYLFADLDPNAGETPDDAKTRYLKKLRTVPEPTLIVDSGNGIQVLWELEEPIQLASPVDKVYSDAEQAKIADVEGRMKTMMERLGSKAGTQNIDRILRLPGTVNIPNKKKREQGRTECLSLTVHGDDGDLGPAHPLSAFRQLKAATSTKASSSEGSELPARLSSLLHIEGSGAYPSRHELVFAFLTGAIRAKVADDTIIAACLDRTFAGKGIYEHIQENGGRTCAIRQLKKAREKLSQQKNDTSDNRPLTTRSLDQFAYRKIKWMWWPFVPLGEVTAFVGEGGTNKSSTILDMAVRIVRGGSWPRFGKDPTEFAPMGSVLIMTKEDDPSTVLRPRVAAAGGNEDVLRKIHLLGFDDPEDPQWFDPIDRIDDKMQKLEQEIAKIGDVKLVAIDAVNDFVGHLQSNDDAQARSIVTPFHRIARRYQLAVIIVLHVNKKEDLSARNRTLGSVAYVNAPRSALVFGEDPMDHHRYMMVQVKRNLTGDSHGVAFRAKSHRAVHRLEWEPDWVTVSADEVLAPNKQKVSKLDQAKQFLSEQLTQGPERGSTLIERAKEAGISKRTLNTAKKEIGVTSKRSGDEWMWSMPRDEE